MLPLSFSNYKLRKSPTVHQKITVSKNVTRYRGVLREGGRWVRAPPPPPPADIMSWSLSSVSGTVETGHLRTRWPFYFFGLQLILWGRLDVGRCEEFFFGLRRYFPWKQKQEIAAPPFSNFWARPCDNNALFKNFCIIVNPKQFF